MTENQIYCGWLDTKTTDRDTRCTRKAILHFTFGRQRYAICRRHLIAYIKAHDEHPVQTDIYDEEWNDYKVYHMDTFIEPNIDLELDGPMHRSAWRMRKDEKRDAWLTAHGFKVLRFDNAFVLKHPERVLAALDEAGAEKWTR